MSIGVTNLENVFTEFKSGVLNCDPDIVGEHFYWNLCRNIKMLEN